MAKKSDVMDDEDEEFSEEETELEDDDDEEQDDEDDDVEEEEALDSDDATIEDSDLGVAELAADVPVQVVAVLGKRTFSMQEVMKFHQGQVIDLYRPANEMVDLVVGGKIIAKGELVSIEGKLGVKIIKMV